MQTEPFTFYEAILYFRGSLTLDLREAYLRPISSRWASIAPQKWAREHQVILSSRGGVLSSVNVSSWR
jgi:hypothetical protein